MDDFTSVIMKESYQLDKIINKHRKYYHRKLCYAIRLYDETMCPACKKYLVILFSESDHEGAEI